jgi:hypothetical protein
LTSQRIVVHQAHIELLAVPYAIPLFVQNVYDDTVVSVSKHHVPSRHGGSGGRALRILNHDVRGRSTVVVKGSLEIPTII